MVDSLKQQAKTVRKRSADNDTYSRLGHPGGSLSAADIMTALYFHELNIRPEEPKWDKQGPVRIIQRPCLPGFVYLPGAQRDILTKI